VVRQGWRGFGDYRCRRLRSGRRSGEETGSLEQARLLVLSHEESGAIGDGVRSRRTTRSREEAAGLRHHGQYEQRFFEVGTNYRLDTGRRSC